MSIDTKKIGKILKGLDGAEYLYMKHCMDMRNSINHLIRKHKLSKEDVCAKFELNPSKYNDFVKGNFNYSVYDMASLNLAFMELEMETLKDNVPAQIAK